jgi:hypothetical protein
VNASVLEGRLSWSGRLPLQWRVLDYMPDEELLLRTDDRNYALLRALALVEERAIHQPEEPSPLVAQMERLEAKFDLVLTLLTEVLLPEAEVPRAVPMRLCAKGLVFEAAYPVEPGAVVEVSIHFSASLPRPVVFFGVVVEPLPGEEAHVSVEFRHIGSGVKERLERLVFRRHRRSIARQRPQLAQ